ncbi:unnamed protein product [Caenorhabditis bovis]|uniref:Collagen triple helix repeat protein n=1 Tax=Caenorhabditis bovis TaxID=2654633 RepID=A0A8S1F2R6_9PELO|nr:unnamed protein product [Caenorhabditis bovis]
MDFGLLGLFPSSEDGESVEARGDSDETVDQASDVESQNITVGGDGAFVNQETTDEGDDGTMRMTMMEEEIDDEFDMSNPCPRGPPGPPGEPGEPGNDGPNGTNGTDGNAWHLDAEDRVIVLGCVKCPPGPRGTEGDPGSPGDRGSAGQNGPPGLDGYEGFPGAPGEPGDPGEDGDDGQDGYPGPSGNPAKRYINFPGPKGEAGPPGAPGENGQPGSTPGRGPRGIAGASGAPGRHGIPGPPGEPGKPGDAGLPAPSGGQCKCPERRTHQPPHRYAYPVPPPHYYAEYTTTPYRYYVRAELPSSSSSSYQEDKIDQMMNTYSEGVETTTEAIYRYLIKNGEPINTDPVGSDEYKEAVHKPAIPTKFDTSP